MWSKKVKLPKNQWESGRSKFLFVRLMEDARRIKPVVFRKKWWERFIDWVKSIYVRRSVSAKT